LEVVIRSSGEVSRYTREELLQEFADTSAGLHKSAESMA
jgi:hypothetical protein